MATTDRRAVLPSTRSEQGYWRLTAGPGEEHTVRSELVTGDGSAAPGEPLLTLGHLSDLHLCDAQSPVRAEFLDRWSDDDAPTKAELGIIGTYRPQEFLTTQVADATVRAMNAVAAGPVGGGSLDRVITTGDVTDNAQSNELNWYVTLLDGGDVVPDSGSTDRYEGVADNAYFDEAFWHPEPHSVQADRPHRLHGFPDVPGLLDAVRRPFTASGLDVGWLGVHGNHDQMIQGTIPAIGPLATADSDTHKVIGLPSFWSTDAIIRFCREFDTSVFDVLAEWPKLPTRSVTVDPSRRVITRAEFVAAHFSAQSRPYGHGFSDAPEHTDRAYYRHDLGRVTILALDTVNEHGGWQGSIEACQLEWLADELLSADRERRYVVLASHHPLWTMTNPRLPLEYRALRDRRRVAHLELDRVLRRHPSLVLWVNGHTHRSTVTPHGTWWEVTAPSLIDFPQQGRVIELLRGSNGELTIAATMLDHDGELPWSGRIDTPTQLAGLARELAVNDWQRQVDDLALQPWAGTRAERNVLLRLPDPYR